MQSQNTLASLVAGVCTTHRSTESHSWLCRYCLGLLSYLQINCGYLSPGLLHSKVVKGVSGRRSAAAAAPRRLGTLLVAQPPESSEVPGQRKLEPARPTPQRGSSSVAECTSERGASSPSGPPRPPSSAPDSRRLSRPRGGAADASCRLPAFSISPFAP